MTPARQTSAADRPEPPPPLLEPPPPGWGCVTASTSVACRAAVAEVPVSRPRDVGSRLASSGRPRTRRFCGRGRPDASLVETPSGRPSAAGARPTAPPRDRRSRAPAPPDDRQRPSRPPVVSCGLIGPPAERRLEVSPSRASGPPPRRRKGQAARGHSPPRSEINAIVTPSSAGGSHYKAHSPGMHRPVVRGMRRPPDLPPARSGQSRSRARVARSPLTPQRPNAPPAHLPPAGDRPATPR